MAKERLYFVSFSIRSGFGSINILVKGKLVVKNLPQTIYESADNNLTKDDQIIVLFYKEFDPKKEVWSKDEL